MNEIVLAIGLTLLFVGSMIGGILYFFNNQQKKYPYLNHYGWVGSGGKK